MKERSYEQAASRLHGLYEENGICTIPIRLGKEGCADVMDAYSARLNSVVATSIDSFRHWVRADSELRLVFYLSDDAATQRCAQMENCVRGSYASASVRAKQRRTRYAGLGVAAALFFAANCFLAIWLYPAELCLLFAAAAGIQVLLFAAASALFIKACIDLRWNERVFSGRMEFH